MQVASGHRGNILIGSTRRGGRAVKNRRELGLHACAESGTLSVALESNDTGSVTEILPTHTAALFDAAVKRAAKMLRSGEVVALPTETVYGLAANALDAAAVRRIFEIKGRPSNNPIIVHGADLEMAQRCVTRWPKEAEVLAHAFWPGPLTLVLPRANDIPNEVTAGGPTVGVRWPSHPFIQSVIRECGFPLAAPSANLSNRVSPTNAAHVFESLNGKIQLIVDGGQSQVGIESTVVDLASGLPRILRPGIIHAGALNAALAGCGARIEETGQERISELRSPGLLPRHYSPRAKLLTLSWNGDADFAKIIAEAGVLKETAHVIAHTNIPSAEGWGRVSVIPHDAEAFARAIYAELHACDTAGAETIIAENVPGTAEWHAIADRLRRAAA